MDLLLSHTGTYMTVLDPGQIFQVARQAGFTNDQAVTFTAIALAESGGRTDANAFGTEDSRGLWQVNVGAHGDVFGNLYNPLVNARAAYEISHQGTYLDPWSVTHDEVRGTTRDYRTYLDEARAGAASVGYSAGDPGAYATDTDGGTYTAVTDGPVIQPVDGVSGDEYSDTWGAARSGGRSHEGVDIMADEGTPVRAIASGEVVQGFDSELGGVVVRIEGDDGHYYYYAHLKEGTVDHLQVGQRVEAGEVIGGVGDTGNAPEGVYHLHLGIYENDVAMNPYPIIEPLPTYEEWASGQNGYDMPDGADVDATDQDEDGLTDEFEELLGTAANRADTDHDDLSDVYETTVSHTDPLVADTDHDGRADSVEVAQGTDAGEAEIPLTAVNAGFGGAGTVDRDHDDLSDLYEAQLGSDPTKADTDKDGLLDGMEQAYGSSLTNIDSDHDGMTDFFEAGEGTLGDPVPGSTSIGDDDPMAPEDPMAADTAEADSDDAPVV